MPTRRFQTIGSSSIRQRSCRKTDARCCSSGAETGPILWKDKHRLPLCHQGQGSPDPLERGDLENVTDGLLMTGSRAEKQAIMANLVSEDGWYIRFESTGEKCLPPGLVFGGVAYFTIFEPDDTVPFDPCENCGEPQDGQAPGPGLPKRQCSLSLASFHSDLFRRSLELGGVNWYGDIPTILGEKGYIDAVLRNEWIRIIGFRNTVVYEYTAIFTIARKIKIKVCPDAWGKFGKALYHVAIPNREWSMNHSRKTTDHRKHRSPTPLGPGSSVFSLRCRLFKSRWA